MNSKGCLEVVMNHPALPLADLQLCHWTNELSFPLESQ